MLPRLNTFFRICLGNCQLSMTWSEQLKTCHFNVVGVDQISFHDMLRHKILEVLGSLQEKNSCHFWNFNRWTSETPVPKVIKLYLGEISKILVYNTGPGCHHHKLRVKNDKNPAEGQVPLLSRSCSALRSGAGSRSCWSPAPSRPSPARWGCSEPETRFIWLVLGSLKKGHKVYFIGSSLVLNWVIKASMDTLLEG